LVNEKHGEKKQNNDKNFDSRSGFPGTYTIPTQILPKSKLNTNIDPTPVKVFYLQVGAFRSIDEADRMRARLAFLGFEASLFKKNKPGSVFYRVRIGPFTSKEELNIVKKRLKGDKIKSHVVSGEKN
jgi:cell division protein FtsN